MTKQTDKIKQKKPQFLFVHVPIVKCVYCNSHTMNIKWICIGLAIKLIMSNQQFRVYRVVVASLARILFLRSQLIQCLSKNLKHSCVPQHSHQNFPNRINIKVYPQLWNWSFFPSGIFVLAFWGWRGNRFWVFIFITLFKLSPILYKCGVWSLSQSQEVLASQILTVGRK